MLHTADAPRRRASRPEQTGELVTVHCESFGDGSFYMVKNSMKKLLAPNISGWGRVVRAVWGAGLIAAALWFSNSATWLRIVLLIAGGFALFEAVRGWCVMRACGIKTRL